MFLQTFLQAGTSLESCGRSIQDIFEADIAPRLQEAPAGLFPASSISFEGFRRAADMVQTRAFHMKADNWLTGASQVQWHALFISSCPYLFLNIILTH
jgi:hypothetical protein